MKRAFMFAALFLGAAAAFLPSLHSAEDDPALRHWRMAERDKLDDRVSKMSKALNLTDDQKISLRAAYEARINNLSDLRGKFIKDSQAVESATDDKITSSLTPEQKAKYDAAKEKIMADERQAEMEKRKESEGSGEGGHGGHGGGHGGGGFGGGHGGGPGGPGGF